MTSPPTIRIAEARARERLAPDDPVGQAELGADRAHLVLEQHPQRLDELEAEVLGQAADVVVGLDRVGAGRPSPPDSITSEYSVPWTRKRTSGSFSRLLLEDADELLADDLALALGLVAPGEAVEEALGRRRRGSA